MDAPTPLHFQRCRSCGRVLGQPRVLCPHCGGRDLAWAASDGRGRVYSATTVHTREETYTVLLVDLDDGVRVMGAGDAAIGDTVRARVEDERLVFRPS